LAQLLFQLKKHIPANPKQTVHQEKTGILLIQIRIEPKNLPTKAQLKKKVVTRLNKNLSPDNWRWLNSGQEAGLSR
jgi:hypothetical protein